MENKDLEDKIKSLESVVEKIKSVVEKNCMDFAEKELEKRTKAENHQFEVIDAICSDYGLVYDKNVLLAEINQENIALEYWCFYFLYRSIPSIIKLEKDRKSLESAVEEKFEEKQETKERIEDLKQRIENLETWRNDLMKEVEKQKELSIVIND